MPDPTWTFTEKNFYLAEFRGRSLAMALPDADLPSLEPLEEVLGDLSANGTRAIVLSPFRPLLEKIAAGEVQPCSEADWEGRLWRRLRTHRRVALELPADAFPTRCREIALRLRLAKLVWIDRRDGLSGPDGKRLSVVDLSDLGRLLEGQAGSVWGSDDLALLREVRLMLAGGLPSVNICGLSGLADELFTYAGSGTFFTRERYAEVRFLALDEFDAAADLIERAVEEGYLLARTQEEIESVLSAGFGVFIEGRYLAGIGSLLHYAERRAGEITALYALTRFLGEGIGAHLIRFATEQAEREAYRYVFACTLSERVESFFERHGFRRVTPDEVPPEKWQGYSPQRREAIRCLRRDLETSPSA